MLLACLAGASAHQQISLLSKWSLRRRSHPLLSLALAHASCPHGRPPLLATLFISPLDTASRVALKAWFVATLLCGDSRYVRPVSLSYHNLLTPALAFPLPCPVTRHASLLCCRPYTSACSSSRHLVHLYVLLHPPRLSPSLLVTYRVFSDYLIDWDREPSTLLAMYVSSCYLDVC